MPGLMLWSDSPSRRMRFAYFLSIFIVFGRYRDSNYSVRWKEIKRHFTREYQKRYGSIGIPDDSRTKRSEGAIWQRRFWEHTIRDQEDLNKHIDYIHFNPVKHGLVKNVSKWPWSSFHRYVKEGYYLERWGEGEGLTDGKGFGE